MLLLPGPEQLLHDLDPLVVERKVDGVAVDVFVPGDLVHARVEREQDRDCV